MRDLVSPFWTTLDPPVAPAGATVRNVSYPNDPAYSHHPSDSGDAQLAASGMETLDDGPVHVATVTVATAETGAVRLSLSVSALGDENGSAYTVGDTQGRTLVVGDQATATPTATPTESDEDSSAGSGGSSGGDSSTGDSSDSDSSDNESSGNDDSTESGTTTDAGTEADSPDEPSTSSPASTATHTSTAGGAVTPEPSTPSSAPTMLLLAGAVLVLAVAGLVYYWI